MSLTDLVGAFTTLEFYAGLTTGALAWKTVQRAVKSMVEKRYGKDD